MKKTFTIICIILIILTGIIFGIIIFNRKDKTETNKGIEEAQKTQKISKEITDECVDEYIELSQVQEVEATSSEEKISPNCKLILKRYYKECEHLINEYIDVPESLVNKTRKEFEEQYKNWEIDKFTSTEIIIYREFESNCGQHYVLRNNEGKISIYKIDDNNEEKLLENTEISVEYLTEKDKVEKQNGIRVNGKEELNKRLEDFE